MPGLYGLLVTESDGNTITASNRNAEHLNHITNATPQMLDDYSANASQMQTQTDPGEVGSESLSTCLSDEISRLRHAIKELKGTTYWYQTQTWAERVAFSTKPSFRANSADTSQVIVPASAAAPASVFINGTLYSVTSNETMDLDTAGRGGLDTGSKASDTTYYLYAIPATSGTTFDLVCSVTAPTGAGPTGFTTAWSYLGAFNTRSTGSTVATFVSSQGRYSSEDASANSHTGNTNWTSKTYKLPSTAKTSFGFLYITGSGGAGDQGLISSLSSGPVSTSPYYVVLQVNGVENDQFVEVPVLTAGTLYLKTSDSSNTVGYWQYGWTENPMEYK